MLLVLVNTTSFVGCLCFINVICLYFGVQHDFHYHMMFVSCKNNATGVTRAGIWLSLYVCAIIYPCAKIKIIQYSLISYSTSLASLRFFRIFFKFIFTKMNKSLDKLEISYLSVHKKLKQKHICTRNCRTHCNFSI